jgi:hypothetical protein
MPSQEAEHVSPMKAVYHRAQGLWTWRSPRQRGGRTSSRRSADVGEGTRLRANQGVGASANQRLNPAKLGRPTEARPRFQTGPGKTGCPGL